MTMQNTGTFNLKRERKCVSSQYRLESGCDNFLANWDELEEMLLL